MPGLPSQGFRGNLSFFPGPLNARLRGNLLLIARTRASGKSSFPSVFPSWPFIHMASGEKLSILSWLYPSGVFGHQRSFPSWPFLVRPPREVLLECETPHHRKIVLQFLLLFSGRFKSRPSRKEFHSFPGSSRVEHPRKSFTRMQMGRRPTTRDRGKSFSGFVSRCMVRLPWHARAEPIFLRQNATARPQHFAPVSRGSLCLTPPN